MFGSSLWLILVAAFLVLSGLGGGSLTDLLLSLIKTK